MDALKPTFLRYNVICVADLYALSCDCRYTVVLLILGRGEKLLSDWSSMFLTGYTATLSGRLCAPLRVGWSSRISARLSCARRSGLRADGGSVLEEDSFSSSLSGV